MRFRFQCILAVLFIFLSSFAHASPAKTWTFLLYLNGDLLEEDIENNIKQLEKVGSNDKVNIVVQWMNVDAKKTARLLIEKSMDANKITSPILEDLGNVDAGDYRSLKDFLAWGIKNYPAEHYAVIIGGHGDGWYNMLQDKQNSFKSVSKRAAFKPMSTFNISYDSSTEHSINIKELSQVLDDATKMIGHKIDLYINDACSMGELEVADQMKNSVHYLIGSANPSPAQGLPYEAIFNNWEALPNVTVEQGIKIISDEFVKAYQTRDTPVILTTYDLTKLSPLTQAITKVGAEILQIDSVSRQKILDVIEPIPAEDGGYKDRILAYALDNDVDLIAFMDVLATIPSINKDDLAAVKKAAKEMVAYNVSTGELKAVNASGISIWVLVGTREYYQDHFNDFSPFYFTMQFHADTQWGKVVQFILRGKLPATTH